MSDTIKRLQEVEVLLNQMKNSTNDHMTFRANLNGFLSLGRSVTFVMQKEFHNVPQFKEWYESKVKEMEKDEIFGFFKELRNISEKQKPIGNKMRFMTTFNAPLGEGKEIIVPFGRVDDRGNLVIDNESKITIDGKPTDDIKQTTTRQYFFDEKPDRDAIELCSEYFQKLVKIGIECDKKFGNEPTVDKEEMSH